MLLNVALALASLVCAAQALRGFSAAAAANAELQRESVAHQLAESRRRSTARLLDNSMAAVEFLQDSVLAAPLAAASAARKDITVRQAIVVPESEILRSLADHPLGESLVRRVLAHAHMQLNESAESARHLERSAALAQETLGPDHSETLAQLNVLAEVRRVAGQLADAHHMHRSNLERARKAFGDSDPRTLTIMNNLAITEFKAGKLDEARQLLELVVQHRMAQPGSADAFTLSAMTNLASTLEQQHAWDRAIAMWEQVLSLRLQLQPPDNRKLLDTYGAYATACAKSGQHAKGAAILTAALQRSRALAAEFPDNPDYRSRLDALLKLQAQHFGQKPEIRVEQSLK